MNLYNCFKTNEYSKNLLIGKNIEIDNFIQEMQLKIDVKFEWIPYNQLNNIRKTSIEFTELCLAIWKNGPLIYDHYKRNWTRELLDCVIGSAATTISY